MSAEAHLFDINLEVPNLPGYWFTIQIRYWGPLSSDSGYYNDNLSNYGPDLISDFEKGYLDIYSIYGLGKWLDEDCNTNTFYQDLNAYLWSHENFVIAVIIGSLNEKNPAQWYWDT